MYIKNSLITLYVLSILSFSVAISKFILDKIISVTYKLCADYFVIASIYNIIPLILVGIIVVYISKKYEKIFNLEGLSLVKSMVNNQIQMPNSFVLYKILLTSLSIGSGSVGGTESPMLQIGSAFGVLYHRITNHLKITTIAYKKLIICGVVAGLTCALNTPFGAVVFAIEIFKDDLKTKDWSKLLQNLLYFIITAYISTNITSLWLHEHIYHLKSIEMQFSYKFVSALMLLCCLSISASLLYFYFKQLCTKIIHNSNRYLIYFGALSINLAIVFAIKHNLGTDYLTHSAYNLFQEIFHLRVLSYSQLLLLAIAQIITIAIMVAIKSPVGSFIPALISGACLGGSCYLFCIEKLDLFAYSNSHYSIFVLFGAASTLAAVLSIPFSASIILIELTQAPIILLLPLLTVSLPSYFSFKHFVSFQGFKN